MNFYYKLDENRNVVACTPEECEEGLRRKAVDENAPGRVARTTIGDYFISTVFLGIDHGYSSEIPILFETMIHNNKTDEWEDYEERYATWEEAHKGHTRAVEWVVNGCKEDEL